MYIDLSSVLPGLDWQTPTNTSQGPPETWGVYQACFIRRIICILRVFEIVFVLLPTAVSEASLPFCWVLINK